MQTTANHNKKRTMYTWGVLYTMNMHVGNFAQIHFPLYRFRSSHMNLTRRTFLWETCVLLPCNFFDSSYGDIYLCYIGQLASWLILRV